VPRYFFDVTDTGKQLLRDREGTELVDLEAARREALETLGGIARDELRDGDDRDFVIELREGAGPVLLRVSVSLRLEWKV
jgi:hypothetical protein